MGRCVAIFVQVLGALCGCRLNEVADDELWELDKLGNATSYQTSGADRDDLHDHKSATTFHIYILKNNNKTAKEK